MTENTRRRCAFIPDKICNVEGDEIPLEVCKLCLETWRSLSNVMVKRSIETSGTLTPITPPQPVERRIENIQPLAPPKRHENVDMALAKLDRLFAEDKISLEEYVKRRKRIVESVGAEKEHFFINENLNDEGYGSGGLVLIGKGMFNGVRIKAISPENWRPPAGFTAKLLNTIYSFYASLNNEVRLEFREFKVTNIAYRNGELVIFVLDSRLDFETFEFEMRKAANRLIAESEWEKVLPRIYEEYFAKQSNLDLRFFSLE